MKTYKKYITIFIVISMVMLAIGASTVNANNNKITPEISENNGLVVTSVSWFKTNSTELPAPGSSGIPVYITFVSCINIKNVNVSLNLSAYKSPLSYTYINGPDKNIRTYNEMQIQAGDSYTIMQLVNISKNSKGSFYDENLSYHNSTISGNTKVTIPVGKPDINVISYTTNPPVIYQNEKFIKLKVYTENTGTSAMKDVNFSINSTDYKAVSPLNYSIAYYPEGKLLNFTFYINAKNITGESLIYFHINNDVYTINTYIHGNAKNNLKISIENKTLVSDAKKQIMMFYINNTGNKVYEDVEIHMLSPSIISIYVSSSNPLGALTANNITFGEIKPGESIKVTFIVNTISNAYGNYPVQLLVQYHFNNTEETFNKVYTYNQEIAPTTTQKISNTLTEPVYEGMLALIIIIIIAIAAVSVHSRRKSKKTLKNNEKSDKNNGNEKKQ